MNEKPDMMINIYGGNNLIAPVASLPPFRTFMATGVMRPPTNRKILRKRRVQKV